MLLVTRIEFTLLLNLFFIFVVIARHESRFHSLEKRKSLRYKLSKPVPRMWNGSLTTYQRHPYFGLLTLRTRDGCFSPACGGVFITPQVFVTAAHCLWRRRKIPVKYLRVRYGVDRAKTTSGNWHQFGKGFDNLVARTFIHPLYVPTRSPFHTREQSADIGLVQLIKPIRHTSFIANLPKPNTDEEYFWEGRASTFVASGSSYGNDSRDRLKEAQVVLLLCAGVGDEFDDFQACSEVEGGFVRGCPGDSGSPFIAETGGARTVIAILSGGHGQCRSKKDMKEDRIMYASRIAPAMPWILNTIMVHTQCHCLHSLSKDWADYYDADFDESRNAPTRL